VLAAAFCPAFAVENARTGLQVTLRSGFDMVCARMEQSGDKVRLYTHAGTDDFVEMNSADIVAVEEVTLPPEPVADTAAATVASDKSSQPMDLHSLTASAGARHDLDADLIASVVHAESAGNPHAVSRTGAKGLMQLMPGTAHEVGVTDSFDPAQNVEGGTAYFNSLLLRYHDNLPLALAAYNAGPGAVDKYHGIPPFRETRAYVARVIHEFNRRKALQQRQGRAVPSPDLVASIVAGR
jgi:soluble lytic murein transglycosylase-like protein